MHERIRLSVDRKWTSQAKSGFTSLFGKIFRNNVSLLLRLVRVCTSLHLLDSITGVAGAPVNHLSEGHLSTTSSASSSSYGDQTPLDYGLSALFLILSIGGLWSMAPAAVSLVTGITWPAVRSDPNFDTAEIWT